MSNKSYSVPDLASANIDTLAMELRSRYFKGDIKRTNRLSYLIQKSTSTEVLQANLEGSGSDISSNFSMFGKRTPSPSRSASPSWFKRASSQELLKDPKETSSTLLLKEARPIGEPEEVLLYTMKDNQRIVLGGTEGKLLELLADELSSGRTAIMAQGRRIKWIIHRSWIYGDFHADLPYMAKSQKADGLAAGSV